MLDFETEALNCRPFALIFETFSYFLILRMSCRSCVNDCVYVDYAYMNEVCATISKVGIKGRSKRRCNKKRMKHKSRDYESSFFSK